MAKLYPPSLGGTVPAFCGSDLTIPFIMNKTVSKSEVYGFNLIVKTVANSKLIGQLRISATIDELGNKRIHQWNQDANEVVFDISKSATLAAALTVGQYYKVQLAYIDVDGIIGYYSSVGIVKYTSEPNVTIEGLDFGVVNMDYGIYVGSYSQEPYYIGNEKKIRDTTERVYNYTFNVYDRFNNLVETSGECLHNSFEDTSTAFSRDTYKLQKELEINQSYYIQYIVTTNNKLVKKSNKYRIMQKETVEAEIQATVHAELKPDNGYIKVSLKSVLDNQNMEIPAYGSFVLKRSSDKDNYSQWDTIYNFKLNGQVPSRWSWKDCTIEHGYTYQYALQQFNDNNLFSNKILSNKVYSYYEDSFLFDGDRQLKIRFNPKVSSFKNVILETKTDTIGSQFPFIFRNGHVYYKEFPISGLISYMSDEEEMFISKEEILLEEETFNLTHNNIASERIFKQKVLEFLNNGKPKLFKSPAEGSYIVRLMNVSLSPTDAVNRMLHTFSATAYEIDHFNYDTSINYGFLKLPEIKNSITRWETVSLFNQFTGKSVSVGQELLEHTPATSILLQDVIPGTQFILKYRENNKDVAQNIVIGPTGMYKIDLEDGLEFYSVSLAGKNTNKPNPEENYYYRDLDLSGSLVYSYQSETFNVFDTISSVQVYDFIIEQYFGDTDVLSKIQNIKRKILKFNYLRFLKRPLYEIYTNDNSHMYWDYECKNSIEDLEDGNIYLVTYINNNTQYYIDGRYPLKKIKECDYSFIIDGQNIDLTETESYELMDISHIKELKLNMGVSLECSYQLSEVTYSIEDTDPALRAKKIDYNMKYERLLTLLRYDIEGPYYNAKDGYTSTYFASVKAAKMALGLLNNEPTLYENYIAELEKALEQQKKASGII